MLKYLPSQTCSLMSSVLLLGVSMIGCANQNRNDVTRPEKPQVVVSNSVLCDLSKQVAQSTVDLTCLINREQDPHTYRTTPSDRQAIAQAELVLYGGYGLEPAITGLVEATELSVPKVAVYEQAVSDPIMAEHHHEEKEHSAAAVEADPHVWHDVQKAIATVAVIENELAQINPSEAELYSQNAQQLEERLQELDAWIKEQVATIPESQRALFTTHDAFNYYVQAYGFQNSEALQGLSTEETPTASQVKNLVQKVKQAGVPTIFAEVTANDRVIATVAREAQVKVSEQELFTGSLGEQGSQSGTYIGAIASNTCIIVEGLGGQCTPFEAGE